MRGLRFDSLGGASGDMILGALFDLGVNVCDVKEVLDSLVPGAFDVSVSRATSRGIAGTRVAVNVPPEAGHSHRRLPEITQLLSAGALPKPTADLSLAVFTSLAEAEARVHGTTSDDVHFHEVGAVDAIVDIVGACHALHLLDVGTVAISPLPLGTGTVTSEHGVLPVPVPAVVELLGDHPVVQTDEEGELVTPTGAALLMSWQHGDESAIPAGAPTGIAATGYGLGHRELAARANVLRAMLLDTEVASGDTSSRECLVIESNIDDTVPELLGSLCQRLLDTGALDVFTTAVQMKKQRPGTLLTVLCTPRQRATLLDLIFAETTTFGVREYCASRTILQRTFEEAVTPFGTVRVKVGFWKGQALTRSPEHSDCIKLAQKHGVSVRRVYEAALKSVAE